MAARLLFFAYGCLAYALFLMTFLYAIAFVVADVAKVIAEEPRPMLPHRAFEVVLQMGEPRGRLDERHAPPHFSPRELDPVRGANVANRLQDLRRHSFVRFGPAHRSFSEGGTFVPGRHARL